MSHRSRVRAPQGVSRWRARRHFMSRESERRGRQLLLSGHPTKCTPGLITHELGNGCAFRMALHFGRNSTAGRKRLWRGVGLALARSQFESQSLAGPRPSLFCFSTSCFARRRSRGSHGPAMMPKRMDWAPELAYSRRDSNPQSPP